MPVGQILRCIVSRVDILANLARYFQALRHSSVINLYIRSVVV
jgi:hypothetical protein